MTPRIGRTLGGFHHRVARCLAEMNRQRDINRAVGLTAFGGGDGGSGYGGGGYIHPPMSEYHIPLHRDLSDTGAVSGGRATAGNAGGTVVVGAGGYQPGGREGDSEGGEGGGGLKGGDRGSGGRGRNME